MEIAGGANDGEKMEKSFPPQPVITICRRNGDGEEGTIRSGRHSVGQTVEAKMQRLME